MPKPVPRGVEWRAESQAVMKRPRCAELLGAIVAEMSFVEAWLAVIYGHLASHPNFRPSGTEQQLIAIESFDSVVSMKIKRSLLLLAAERRQLPKDRLSKLVRILRLVQDIYKKRIVSAHGRWCISDALPDSVVFVRNAGRLKEPAVYDPADLRSDLESIANVAKQLQQFYADDVLAVLPIESNADPV